MFVVADLPPLVDVVLKVTVLLGHRGACGPRTVAPLSRRAASGVGRRDCRVAADAGARDRGAAVDDCGAARVRRQRLTRRTRPLPAVADDRGGGSSVRADSRRDTERERGATAGGIARARLSTATTIWLAGVLLVLARLAFGTARVWWIARRATPAPVWAPLGQQLAQSLGIRRPVTFLSGDEDAMPMACGLAARARAAAGRGRRLAARAPARRPAPRAGAREAPRLS